MGESSVDAPLSSTEQDPLDLQRLASEYADLKSAEEEQATSDDLALHDAQLLRLSLQGQLQRYQEKRPNAEEFAERYEAEIDELTADVRRLREENIVLASRNRTEQEVVNASPRTPSGCSSGRPSTNSAPGVPVAPRRLPWSPRKNVGNGSPRALAHVADEAHQLWQCRTEVSARKRRIRVDEWYLARLRAEMQEVARALRAKERKVIQLKQNCDEVVALRQDLSADTSRCNEDLVVERRSVAGLHQEILDVKESCIAPAQVKKKSSNLMKFLDQEGGRLNTERHLRGLQAAAKLCRGVSVHAPSVQPLASQAKVAMEEEFAKYRQLEQGHTRQLQRLP